MSDLFYRFKFKSDLFELELESTDSEFIDRKIMQLVELSTRPIEDGPKLLSSASQIPGGHAPAEEAPIEDAEPEEEEADEVEATPEPAAPKKKKRKRRKRKTVAKPRTNKVSGKGSTARKKSADIDAEAVADAVKSSQYYPTIEKKILGKANQLNRILLSFYFAEQLYGKKGLTTGDVEDITEALNAGIKSTNVSSQLKKHDKMFNTRGERKRGSVVHYSVKKSGKEKLEQLIQSGE